MDRTDSSAARKRRFAFSTPRLVALVGWCGLVGYLLAHLLYDLGAGWLL